MIGSIFLLVILILLNAVFASAEIAVLSMNEAKLKLLTEQGNKKAIKLTKLTRQPHPFDLRRRHAVIRQKFPHQRITLLLLILSIGVTAMVGSHIY